MSDTHERTAQVRASLVALRRAQDPAKASALSRQAVDRFLQAAGLKASDWKGLLGGALAHCPKSWICARLKLSSSPWVRSSCFPRVLDPKTREMEMASGLLSPEGADPSLSPVKPWPIGDFGIEEPPAVRPRCGPCPDRLDSVPGVAFGLQGERVGMGRDLRPGSLQKRPEALKVALASCCSSSKRTRRSRSG